jgi:hypothetical protein
MCNYATLINCGQGYVIRCNKCDRIQVAFGTSVISFTRVQYEGYVVLVDDKYKEYRYTRCREEKVVTIPAPVAGVSTILTVRELCMLRYLLLEGRRKLTQIELYSFSDN